MKLKEMKPEIDANKINRPRIVSPQEWEAARQQLLVKEKELTRDGTLVPPPRRVPPRVPIQRRVKRLLRLKPADIWRTKAI
jgi:predicted dithiol-disulfide oxidoreductase (DUF899 family)